MSITYKVSGSFRNTERFLDRASKSDIRRILERYGREGVAALRSATPVDSGETAASWDYEIEVNGDKRAIYWTNSNINDGVSIAVILQYGHATGTGGYVQGRDYINPTMQTIFDQIADDAWKEVTGQ